VTGAERVRLRMPPAVVLARGLRLVAAGRRLRADWLDTGVPHAVVAVPSVERYPVVEVGRALRRHPAFGRAGANVDFVAMARRPMPLRTYERGVEDETLACGSGAVAAALSAHLARGARAPIALATRGGELLKVDFKPPVPGPRPRFEEVWLEGPARVVFEGRFPL
jgi:diaminopimelate epimerase